MELYQLVYVSKASHAFSAPELVDLLAQAQRNNQQARISGSLIYNAGLFLHAIEGDRSVILALYDRIAADPRHGAMELLYLAPAEYRVFGRWSMNMINLDVDKPENRETLRAIVAAAVRGEKVDLLPAPLRLLQEFQRDAGPDNAT